MRQTAVVTCVVAVACGFTLLATPAQAVESAPTSYTAFTKCTRGVTNLLTGWVEIPKRIQETSETSGAAAGFTWGILRGIGYGFIRTAAGAYELLTFPFPAPPNYEPVIQPEYVFSVGPEPPPSTY